MSVNNTASKVGKTKGLVKNTIILTAGNFSSKIMTVLLVPLYTSILSTAEYGSYDIIYSAINLLIPILTLNIADGILRFSMEPQAQIRRIAKIGFVLVAASSVVVLAGQILPNAPWSNAAGIHYFAALYCSTALYQIMNSLTRGLNRMVDIAVASVVSTAMLLILNILFLLVMNMGLGGFFVANILSQAVPALYLFIRARKAVFTSTQASGDQELYVRMVRYSAPLAITLIGWWLLNTADRYIVLWFCGVEANGLYSAAYRIPNMINTISTIFIQAWQVSVVKSFDADDSDGFLRNTFALVESLLVVICAVAIPLSPFIASVLFQGDFYKAWVYVPLLLVYSMINSMSGMWTPFFSARFANKPIVVSTIAGGAISIGLAVLLVPCIGVHGAVVSSIIGAFVNWAYRGCQNKRNINASFKMHRSMIAQALLITSAGLTISGLEWASKALLSVVVIASLVFIYRQEIRSGVHLVALGIRNSIRKAGSSR